MDDAMVREVRITRIFDAPRELVWAAWTEAEQLKQWFMPHGCTVPECEMDLRQGGRLHMLVRGPDGMEMANDGEFHQVDPPERFVLTTSAFEGPDAAAAAGGAEPADAFSDSSGGDAEHRRLREGGGRCEF